MRERRWSPPLRWANGVRVVRSDAWLARLLANPSGVRAGGRFGGIVGANNYIHNAHWVAEYDRRVVERGMAVHPFFRPEAVAARNAAAARRIRFRPMNFNGRMVCPADMHYQLRSAWRRFWPTVARERSAAQRVRMMRDFANVHHLCRSCGRAPAGGMAYNQRHGCVCPPAAHVIAGAYEEARRLGRLRV